MVSACTGDVLRVEPISSNPLNNWLNESAKSTTIGDDFEINITSVSGSITGTTTGYETLGTDRTVLGSISTWNAETVVTDVARVRIRETGSVVDDIDVNITFRVDTLP